MVGGTHPNKNSHNKSLSIKPPLLVTSVPFIKILVNIIISWSVDVISPICRWKVWVSSFHRPTNATTNVWLRFMWCTWLISPPRMQIPSTNRFLNILQLNIRLCWTMDLVLQRILYMPLFYCINTFRFVSESFHNL